MRSLRVPAAIAGHISAPDSLRRRLQPVATRRQPSRRLPRQSRRHCPR
uniref:Uncharacterized protein n=1 Tax=Arundo donax TaxID=35708 RepID=A0A0A9BW94_ARUDO